MIVYLVKSTILLALLWGLYTLLLENEKMHRFNRFYLLAALAIGLTAPLIQFEIQPNSKVGGIDLVQIDQIVEAPSEFVVESIKPLVTDNPILEEQLTVPYITPRYNTFALLLILAYIAIATIFLGKFVFGLHEIFTSLKKGKIITWKDTALVLMDEAVTPQSFLKWIFLNREDYESGKIGDEILEHERTHIKQKHSLDVLIIEALKVVFWFNPFIYGFRNAILLNHEFLADEHVVTHVSDRKKYQETLLEFATSEVTTSMTNKFAVSVSKARFKMLSSSRSKFRSMRRALLVMLALSAITFMFCTDSGTKYENLSFKELGEMFPASYEDVELSKNEDGLWIDINSVPYSGVQQVFRIDSDQLVYTNHYRNGFLFESELFNVNPQGEPIIKGIVKYAIDPEGNLNTKIFSETGDNAMTLFVEFTDYEDTRNQKYYYLSGNLHSDKNMLRPASGKGIAYHGLFTEYDEDGIITKQELYDNGELVEKIK